MNYVLTLNDAQTKALVDFYRNAKVKPPNENVKAFIKTDNLIVTVYHSNKVVFQGKQAEEAFFFWHETFDMPELQTKSQPASSVDYFTPSIGSDESGVGDYFGPLTVCAAYVDDEIKQTLDVKTIKDSKTVSDEEILALAPKLMKSVPHALYILHNKKYNQLVEKGYNAHHLKAYLHAQSHKKLITKIKKRPTIVIDQFCREETYMHYLQKFKDPIKPDVFLTKAESHYASVAIASIIARYAYLEELRKLGEILGVELKKGASKAVDEQAHDLLKKYGSNRLKTFAKIHFKTTRKASSLPR